MKVLRNLIHQDPWVYGAVYIVLIFVFSIAYYFIGETNKTLIPIDSWYFSVVTITTLGYGDILPDDCVAKVLSGIQAICGVALIGLYLNAISEKRTKCLREMENEENRKTLEMHFRLLVEALQSGNPFIWDKHANYAKSFEELKPFALEVKSSIFDDDCKLSSLQIKALLETSHQIYDTLVGLIPVAANISGSTAAVWVSFVSNIRNLDNQYKLVVKRKEESDADEYAWPAKEIVGLQIQEFIKSGCIISGVVE